ncbi:hypothetical protein BLNAU_13207 [Blattamonas nauphoetae]|uniref:Uncharacterized protein n=1 Tax=Blattamonas nauphoetae TaxID=2049346 RepID=A0ABQ9XMJ4_9EUKA|nr:hypothetical protein BLNAU_13207 [Blattamonas nauphoetae]
MALVEPSWDVNSLCFDSVNDILYTGGRDGTIKSWSLKGDFTDTHCDRSFEGHDGWINCVRLLNENTYKTIRVWDTKTGETKAILKHHSDSILSLCVAENSASFCSAGTDGNLFQYNIEVTDAGRTVLRTQLPKAIEQLSGFEGFFNNCVIYDNFGPNSERHTFVHKDIVHSILFSEDDQFLITGCADGSLRVFELIDFTKVVEIPFHDPILCMVTPGPSVSMIYLGHRSGAIRAVHFDFQTQQLLFLKHQSIYRNYPIDQRLAMQGKTSYSGIFPSSSKQGVSGTQTKTDGYDYYGYGYTYSYGSSRNDSGSGSKGSESDNSSYESETGYSSKSRDESSGSSSSAKYVSSSSPARTGVSDDETHQRTDSSQTSQTATTSPSSAPSTSDPSPQTTTPSETSAPHTVQTSPIASFPPTPTGEQRIPPSLTKASKTPSSTTKSRKKKKTSTQRRSEKLSRLTALPPFVPESVSDILLSDVDRDRDDEFHSLHSTSMHDLNSTFRLTPTHAPYLSERPPPLHSSVSSSFSDDGERRQSEIFHIWLYPYLHPFFKILHKPTVKDELTLKQQKGFILNPRRKKTDNRYTPQPGTVAKMDQAKFRPGVKERHVVAQRIVSDETESGQAKGLNLNSVLDMVFVWKTAEGGQRVLMLCVTRANRRIEFWPVFRDRNDPSYSEPLFDIECSPGIVELRKLSNQMHILSRDEDGTVCLWNVLTGRKEDTLGKGEIDQYVSQFPQPQQFRREWYEANSHLGHVSVTLTTPSCFRCVFPTFQHVAIPHMKKRKRGEDRAKDGTHSHLRSPRKRVPSRTRQPGEVKETSDGSDSSDNTDTDNEEYVEYCHMVNLGEECLLNLFESWDGWDLVHDTPLKDVNPTDPPISEPIFPPSTDIICRDCDGIVIFHETVENLTHLPVVPHPLYSTLIPNSSNFSEITAFYPFEQTQNNFHSKSNPRSVYSGLHTSHPNPDPDSSSDNFSSNPNSSGNLTEFIATSQITPQPAPNPRKEKLSSLSSVISPPFSTALTTHTTIPQSESCFYPYKTVHTNSLTDCVIGGNDDLSTVDPINALISFNSPPHTPLSPMEQSEQTLSASTSHLHRPHKYHQFAQQALLDKYMDMQKNTHQSQLRRKSALTADGPYPTCVPRWIAYSVIRGDLPCQPVLVTYQLVHSDRNPMQNSPQVETSPNKPLSLSSHHTLLPSLPSIGVYSFTAIETLLISSVHSFLYSVYQTLSPSLRIIPDTHNQTKTSSHEGFHTPSTSVRSITSIVSTLVQNKDISLSCNGSLLHLWDTLATVKAKHWKMADPVIIHYHHSVPS